MGAMITDGTYRIAKVVATWKDEHGHVHVIAPCGNCRQMMKEMDEENLHTEVILDRDKTVRLEELLPYHDWWKRQ
jgi:cytidine deaminase